MGFTWKGQFYYERCLPLGTKSSCQIFEKLGTALQWVMLNKLEAGGMSHMLDDFFFIGPPQSEKCKNHLMNLFDLCGRINIPINDKNFLASNMHHHLWYFRLILLI